MIAPFRNISLFEEIFKKFYNPLVNFVFKRYVNDYDVSAEITRATFIKIWINKEEIFLETSIRNFLFKAVKNEALSYLKSNKEDKKDSLSIDNKFGVLDENFNPDSESILYQHIIAMATGKMDSQMKTIFELYKIDQLSLFEIAKKMNITKTKVMENIQKAFKILNAELDASGFYIKV